MKDAISFPISKTKIKKYIDAHTHRLLYCRTTVTIRTDQTDRKINKTKINCRWVCVGTVRRLAYCTVLCLRRSKISQNQKKKN